MSVSTYRPKNQRERLMQAREAFLRLAALEPRLLRLEAEAIEAAHRLRSFELRLRWWYGRFGGGKRKVETMVGWYCQSERPELSTQRAYDIGYQWCIDVLTDAATRRVAEEGRA